MKKLFTAYPADIDRFNDAKKKKLEFIILNHQRPILEQFLSLADHLSDGNTQYKSIKTKDVKSGFTGLPKSRKYQNVLINLMNLENKLIKEAKLLRLQTKEVCNILNEKIKTH